jgi:hypothetical protein
VKIYRRPLLTEGYHHCWIPLHGKFHHHAIKTEVSINQNVIYSGLDVDDTQYYGSALNMETGEVITCKCRPTLKGSSKTVGLIHPDIVFAA